MKSIPLAAALGIASLALAPAAGAAPPPAVPRPGMALDLNGHWRTTPASDVDTAPERPREEWGTVRLPGAVPGTRNGEAPRAAWLEREVAVPAEWQGRRILLRSELAEQALTVFVDGQRAADLTPPGDGVDLTDALAPGQTNVLRVFLVEQEMEPIAGDISDLVGYVGSFGIAGSLRLDALAPQIAIDDVFLMPSTRTRALGARLRLNAAATTDALHLRAVITETNGAPGPTLHCDLADIAAGESYHDVSFAWTNPVPWELGRPHLYDVVIQAVDVEGATLDEWGPQIFGFREFWVDGKDMFMNGHPCRFRLLWHWGVDTNNLAFFKAMGFNAVAIQPRDGGWFRNWGRNTDIDRLASLLDRNGMALVATARTMNGITGSPRTHPTNSPFKESQRLRDYFERASHARIWRYANHPSILVWNIALNAGNDISEYFPEHLGRTPTADRAEHPVALAADIVDQLDPTRSVMSHAAGNIAPVTSANCYLNFIPLQEREEWLSEWARSGTRPWSAIEFGPPYIANFYRKGGPEPLYTEYCAMFLGDEAYRLEQTAYVEQVEALTRANADGHGNGSRPAVATTAFFPVVTEFVRRTERAWRTWGHGGGNHQWMWNIGFGSEPAGPMGCWFYTDMHGSAAELAQRPTWANPYYDVYREVSQPFLAYIGGRAERFTEHDHAFFPGESVEKQIIAIWDGGWPRTVEGTCTVSLDGHDLVSIPVRLDLGPGEIRQWPFHFTIPADAGAARGRIRLEIQQDGDGPLTDRFDFQVVPRPPALAATNVVQVWDPAGESIDWITGLGLQTEAWTPGAPLAANSTLIIGRNALANAERLPFGRDELDGGATVLVLEQPPGALRAMGFRVEDAYSRRLFPRDREHPALAGIEPPMLRDFRGNATLLPDRLPAQLDLHRMRGAHWGNYGVVASALIETPHRGGFMPIIDGGFDMRYSPLIEWRCGRGRVVFCQVDLTDRVGVDPCVTRLAHNLATYVANPPPVRSRRAVYLGGPTGRKLVDDTGLEIDTQTRAEDLPRALDAAELVIVGEGIADELRRHRRALAKFVKRGGWVFSLPKSPDELNGDWLPFKVRTRTRRAHRAGTEPIDAAPFRGLGPADFHWRDVGEFDLFTAGGQARGAQSLGDGFFLLKESKGGGGWLLSQADPAVFSDERAGLVELPPYPSSYHTDRKNTRTVPKPWLRYTRQRLDRLYAQVLANLGAEPASELVDRVLMFVAAPDYRRHEEFETTEPFSGTEFKQVQPPEPGWAEANPGDEPAAVAWQPTPDAGVRRRTGHHPNITYFFRTSVDAPRAATIPMRMHPSPQAEVAVWVNGDRVVDRFQQDSWWAFTSLEADLPLKQGRNELLLKIQRASSFRLFLRDFVDPRLTEEQIDLLYRDPLRYGDDPYYFIPW